MRNKKSALPDLSMGEGAVEKLLLMGRALAAGRMERFLYVLLATPIDPMVGLGVLHFILP